MSHAARCHWLPLADRFLHLHLHDNPLVMRLAVSWAAYVSGASQDCSPSGGQCSDRRPEVLLADFTVPAAGGKGAKKQDGAKQQDAKGPKSPAPSAQGGGAEVRCPVPPCSRNNSHLTFTVRVHSGCCTAASPPWAQCRCAGIENMKAPPVRPHIAQFQGESLLSAGAPAAGGRLHGPAQLQHPAHHRTAAAGV